MTIEPTIFLADDDAYSLLLYEQHLQNLGYSRIELVNTGEKLLDKLYEQPDVLFLDYDMGDYQGLELMYAVQSLSPSTTIVILSGQQEMVISMKLLNQGAFDYIIKDEYALDRITNVMNRWIATAND